MSHGALPVPPALDPLPPAVREDLAGVGDLARRRRDPVFVVGGLVRDTLLGRPTLDVDLVVEGDGLAFADALARELGARCRIHREFLTAQVEHPHLGIVDIATARRESYPAPAALPVVVPASLREDLGRRDFAVNALALRLDRPAFIDPFGGLQDLAARQMRVLHEGSFRDDPTRILRGVRLGARLGFRFEDGTDALARRAIAEGAFEPLSGSRLRAELELLAGENSDTEHQGVRWLVDLGFFEAVLALPAPAGPGPTRGEGEDPLLLLLLGLSRGRNERALADRLQLAGRIRRCLIGAGERAEQARAVLSRPAVRAHEVHQALASLSTEELRWLALEPAPVGPWAKEDLERLRPLALRVQGRDLVALGALPGPRIGRILEVVRSARLDGDIAADGELALAERLVREVG